MSLTLDCCVAGEPGCESTESEDEEEISLLKKEAVMPIDELIATNYTDKYSPRTPLNVSDQGSSSTKSTSSKDVLSTTSDIKSGDEASSDSDSQSSKSEDISESDDTICEDWSKESEDISAEADHLSAKVNGEKEELANGKSKESLDSSTDSQRNGSLNGGVKGEDNKSLDANGDEVKDNCDDLVVEGKAISLSSSSEESPSYSGKGKTGGKGGKVKGASAITTVTTSTTTPKQRPSPASTTQLFVADFKKVLSGTDLSSDDDDDEQKDETFALK